MRTANPVSHKLTAFTAIAMLAGCSGGSSQLSQTPFAQIPGAGAQSLQSQAQDSRRDRILGLSGGIVSRHALTTPSFMNPSSATRPLIFVSDFLGNDVNIYLQRRKNKLVGQVTGLNGEQGLTTDAARNLYVANTNSSDVPIYAPPYTGAPTLTLDDTGNAPVDVAVSPLGVVGVVNYCTLPSCSTGTSSVSFYAMNSTKACATVIVNQANVSYGAFDGKGNLYVTGSYVASGHFFTFIGEVKKGCNATKITQLTTTNAFDGIGGIKIDKADRIAILNNPYVYQWVIDTYNPPTKGALGNPVSTTPLTLSSSEAITAFAFAASGSNLYAAVSSGSSGFVNKYKYTAGGAPAKSILLSGFPDGIAVTPPLLP